MTKENVERVIKEYQYIGTHAFNIFKEYAKMNNDYMDSRYEAARKYTKETGIKTPELEVLTERDSIQGLKIPVQKVDFDFNGLIDSLVYFEGEEYCCGSTEIHYFSFPTSYLYDPNWKEAAMKDIEKKLEDEINKRTERYEEELKRKEENERKEYERLQKKYGQPKPC